MLDQRHNYKDCRKNVLTLGLIDLEYQKTTSNCSRLFESSVIQGALAFTDKQRQ